MKKREHVGNMENKETQRTIEAHSSEDPAVCGLHRTLPRLLTCLITIVRPRIKREKHVLGLTDKYE